MLVNCAKIVGPPVIGQEKEETFFSGMIHEDIMKRISIDVFFVQTPFACC